MKRLHWIITALLLIAVFLVHLPSIDFRPSHDSLKLAAMFSGNTLLLPIRHKVRSETYAQPNAICYDSNLKYQQQLSVVQGIFGPDNVTEYSYYDGGRTGFHIHCMQEDGSADDYGIFLRSDRESFFLTNLYAEISFGPAPARSSSVLLPYHFITDARLLRAESATLHIGVEYEIGPRSNEFGVSALNEGYSISKRVREFYDFYQASGQYVVEQSGDVLTIAKGEETLTLTFFSHAGLVYFSIQ